jgi:hypothetical protein
MTITLLAPMPSVTETLRDLLAASDATLYRVAKDTGISWNTLNRFLTGGGLRSEHVDALASYFGVALKPDREPAKKRPRE